MGVKVEFTFRFGAPIRLTAKFTDPNRVVDPLDPDPETDEVAHTLVDPTTVTAKLKKPDGTIVTKLYGTDVEVVRDDVGRFHMDVTCDMSGTWTFGWIGTGAGAAVNDDAFKVTANPFP